MSLYAKPVTQDEMLQLQHGIRAFQNATEANDDANTINTTAKSVADVAFQMITDTVPTGGVAMADFGIMINAPTQAQFDNIVLNFLPGQVLNAVIHGLNPTVYAAEALGLALSGDSTFQSNFAVPSSGEFSGASRAVFEAITANKTGINTAVIDGWLTNWINFYTNNPGTHNGLTVSQAAAGATVGDAIGVALLNHTSANLDFSHADGHAHGYVANALIDQAEGILQPGVSLVGQPAHSLLQGELPGGI